MIPALRPLPPGKGEFLLHPTVPPPYPDANRIKPDHDEVVT